MKLEELKKALYESYTRDLCYPSVQKNWSEENKTVGMCTITALVIQDYFGGKIAKVKKEDILHYFNIIDGEIIDATALQFKTEIAYEKNKIAYRKQLLKIQSVKKRYEILKKRVQTILLKEIDSIIYTCKHCLPFVEKFPNASTVFLGENNDVILIGEAPANNGWRKSGMCWKDKKGKILPSGVVLQKLFTIISKDIFKTTFLEAVKCYPVERKNIKMCAKNCQPFLYKQLEILQPKLVITLGEFPTRILLPFPFSTFKEVVGKVYEVQNYKILPIYHPSPISPQSFVGNEPIFKKIKDLFIEE